MALLGKTEPRIFTPPLRELTPETSLGFEAVEAASLIGRKLHPWQEWFLIHSMELAPGSYTSDVYPEFRFKTVLLLVARQNGKSFIMSTRLLWRMLMWDGPEEEPALILGTAHKLSAAEEILDLSVSAVRSSPLADVIERKSNVNGNKFLELKPDTTSRVKREKGARYKCEAASDEGGRGLSVTDLAFDELRQQRDWSAWNALTNTTNARFSSQVIAVSNAGEGKSDVLRSLRAQALKRIEDYHTLVTSGQMSIEEYAGTHDITTGLFEWSAPEDCDINDREGWAAANPSLGHPNEQGIVLVNEQTIAAKASLVGVGGSEGIPEHSFRTENLCQWVTAQVDGPFTDEQIASVRDIDSQIADDSPLVVAVDTSHDRSASYVAVAGYRDDGLPHVEIITQRSGTVWVPQLLSRGLEFTPDAVVVQGRGAPATSLIEYIEREGVEVTLCQGTDITNACLQFNDHVVNGRVRTIGQEPLEMGMRDGVKKMLGEVWVWNRAKSPVDVAPLCAVTEALWGLEQLSDSGRVKVTAYGDDYERWW